VAASNKTVKQVVATGAEIEVMSASFVGCGELLRKRGAQSGERHEAGAHFGNHASTKLKSMTNQAAKWPAVLGKLRRGKLEIFGDCPGHRTELKRVGDFSLRGSACACLAGSIAVNLTRVMVSAVIRTYDWSCK
jgi:hypothetical protein